MQCWEIQTEQVCLLLIDALWRLDMSYRNTNTVSLLPLYTVCVCVTGLETERRLKRKTWLVRLCRYTRENVLWFTVCRVCIWYLCHDNTSSPEQVQLVYISTVKQEVDGSFSKLKWPFKLWTPAKSHRYARCLQTFPSRSIIYRSFGDFVCFGVHAYRVCVFKRLMRSTSGVWLWS